MGYYDNSYNNSFIGYYITDYSTVLNTSAPMNGTPILFADLVQGMLYSKKFINGQAYIQQYKIEPINNIGEPSQSDDLKKELEDLRKEIKLLKENKDESK